MANTVIGFTIDIEGIDSINALNDEIKKTNEQLKAAKVGTDEYKEASLKLAELKAVQADLRKEQAELTKEFRKSAKELSAFDEAKKELKELENQYKSLVIEGKENTEQSQKLKARIVELQGTLKKANKEVKDGNRTYKQTSNRLVELRNRFKDLALEGKGSTKEAKELKEEIKKLDKALKNADKEVGQFGRNVGNYPRLFGLSTKSLGQFIPGLDQLSERLDKATGGSNILGKALIGGFVAFKAGQFLVDIFQQFDELIKKIDETRNAVAVFAELGGEDLDRVTASVTALATTFDTDAEQINKSAKALADSLGISFEEALSKVEAGLLSGQASQEEFLSAIEETPEAFADISEAAGDYSSRQKELLEANKELAQAQIELTNQFAGTAGGLKTFATQAQAFLIKTLLSIVKIFQPVVDAFKDAGAAISELLSGFKQFQGEGGALKGILDFLLIPLKTFAGLIQTAANGIRLFADFLRGLIEQSPALQKFIEFNINAFKQITGFFADLPAIFAGVVEAIKQLATNFKQFFEVSFIDAQIFAARVKGIFTGAVQDEINALRKRRKQITDEGRSIFEAFEEGRSAARQAAADRAAEREAAQQKANLEAQEKARSEAARKERAKRIEEQKELNKQLQKERDKFLESEAAFIEKQIQILGKLRERQEVLIIEGISNAEEKARAKAKAAQAQRIAQAEQNFESLKDILQKREAEALRLFGEDSEEIQKLREDNAQRIIEGEKELSGIVTRERISLTNELLKIEEDFIKKRNEAQIKQLEDRQQRERDELERASLILDERFAKGLIKEEEFAEESFKLQKERLKRELELLEEREKELAKLGVEVSQEQNSQILTEKQKLYTQLAQLDKGFADQQKKNSEDVTKKTEEENAKRLQDFQNTFSQVVEGFQIGLSFLDDIQSASENRRLKSLEKQEEANQLQNEQLQERLSQASGLEAQFLQRQIDSNIRAADTIAQNREKIEKERAKRAKARAIIESIIQTALAVVQALPDPVTATLAGIAGAAATATIAAQPLAKGGKVGELSGDVVQFAAGGKVTNRGNIKPLSNGDNVLATLKTGEVVLNKGQQRALGGPATFAAIGVPGFALGGRVGAPLTLATKGEKLSQDQTEILSRLEEAISLNSARIDNLRVVWTSESQSEQDKGLEEREQIQANATF